MQPIKSPAKSKCKQPQGWEGCSHGLRGALGGSALATWQLGQFLATSSMSESIFGHQMYECANTCMLQCGYRAALLALGYPGGGTTAHESHKMHLSSILSSSFLVKNGLKIITQVCSKPNL